MHVLRLFNETMALLVEPPDLVKKVLLKDVQVEHIRGMESIIEKAELIIYTDGLDIKLLKIARKNKAKRPAKKNKTKRKSM